MIINLNHEYFSIFSSRHVPLGFRSVLIECGYKAKNSGRSGSCKRIVIHPVHPAPIRVRTRPVCPPQAGRTFLNGGWLAADALRRETRWIAQDCRRIPDPARVRLLFDQSSERGLNGFAGANSPAKARSCTSHADAPALRAAIIFSGSTYSPIGRAAKNGEVFMCSVAVMLLQRSRALRE
jgi:hypothetical protein